MKKISLLAILLLLLARNALAGLVQKTSCYEYSGTCANTSISCTLNGVTSGNTILVGTALVSGATPAVTSITSTGNTCAANDCVKANGTLTNGSSGSCLNVTGGNTTVTVNFSSTGTICSDTVYLVETTPISALDKCGTASGFSSTVASGTTATTTTAIDFVFGIAALYASGGALALSSGPSLGFAELRDADAGSQFCTANSLPKACCTNPGTGTCSNNYFAFGASLTTSTTGTYGTAWTAGASANYAGIAAAYAFAATATPTATLTATPTATTSATPTATATLTATPSATATPTATTSATATATTSATATATATLSATPTPTATPSSQCNAFFGKKQGKKLGLQQTCR